MSYYYRMRLQYDGTDYFGFQWQKDIPSIQNDLNLALAKLVSGNFSTMGASRTDSGVHALEQFAKITSDHPIECGNFPETLNGFLPAAIRCLDIVPSEKAFKPTSDSVSKEYRYLFTNAIGSNHTERRFIANNPYPLNLEAMRICAAAVVGKKDFKNFVSTGSNVTTTIREISLCEISEVSPSELFQGTGIFNGGDVEKCFQLRIEGNGFLKHMIRHLMTALWKVGNGRMTVEEFLSVLNGPKKEKRLWKVAHPKGLFLWRIHYTDNF
jgi:tRNA pseudouridine38-40 synthase